MADPFPQLYQPQLATLVREAPSGEEWIHEVKFDGYRIGAFKDGEEVRLISRNGNDWTSSFPEIAAATRALECRTTVLDGEATIVLPSGLTSFQALQNAFGGGRRRGLVYWAFDLLFLDGQDLTARTVEERKKALRRLVGEPRDDAVIRYSAHVVGGGPQLHRDACAMGAEGIISKRRTGGYRAGKTQGWVKTKCILRQEFVIAGFTDPEGSRDGIGALLAAYHDDEGRLQFAGKVGTGFTQRSARETRARLEPLEQKACPLAVRPPGWLGRNAHWVKPELVCEVVFSEWTGEGKIRHPSFQGLRTDKSAAEVVRETPVTAQYATSPRRAGAGKRATPKAASEPSAAYRPPAAGAKRLEGAVEVLGVTVTHPGRVLYAGEGITKLDVARYFERVADWMLPHVVDRPLTLVRCPTGINGECHFMKHSKVWAPEPLRRVTIREKTKVGEYLVIESPASLIALAQMDIVEVHTWNTRWQRVELPDRVVFDLDPGPEVGWPEVVEAAQRVRRALEALGLQSWVKTTGGFGLHIVVPLLPERDWSEVFAFSRGLTAAIAAKFPQRYTTRMPKKGREKKILLDYLRNNRTNTSVAAFSPRAKAGAPVSVPLAWREVTAKLQPSSFTMQTIFRRLDRQREDPWREYHRTQQRLTREMIEAVGGVD